MKKGLKEFFDVNDNMSVNNTTLWCAHKAYARGLLIQITAREKKNRNNTINSILVEISNLEKLHKKNPQNIILERQLNNLRSDLRSLLIADHDKYLKKLNLKYYSQGNRAGKLMASQIKLCQQRNKIHKLTHHTSGKTILNPKEIADTFSLYYETLYNLKNDTLTPQPNADNISSFLDNIVLPSIDPTSLELLNKPISDEEIIKVIHELPKNKSPGPDGLSGEYYTAFEETLVPYLSNLFNQAANSEALAKELLEAIIITIPKSGKDPTSPLNYRPISLLNSDLKIYAKILANRLVNIIPTLIKPDQVRFVKSRQAPDSTRRMLNIINSIHNNRTPALLLALDAEKAFDRMHWEYISKTLTKFGFNGFIHSAIMALYTQPNAKVYTSGILSRNFPLTNGTRQGCPLSPIIFALAIEPLAEYIRSSPNVRGVTIGQDVHKLGLFADDIILTLTEPDISLPTIHAILEKFKDVSYYKINQEKCFILPMNIPDSTINSLRPTHKYNWDNKSITYLGIQPGA